ncbi:MAG: Crp/Fnr family transcriptional regulator [Candidatus Velthaea sp.]|jgi:CRP/FNR family transcriptional regulator
MNLGELDAARRSALFAGAAGLRLARGECAYAAGDPCDRVFLVDEGRIKVVRTTAEGGESIVGLRAPGEIFGEIGWLREGRSRATSAVAIEPVVARSLAAAVFAERTRADAVVARAYARGIARRLSALEGELTELAGKSVPGRLVDLLGRLASEHGIPEAGGSLRIGLALTHKELADLIGTSRETLTKELGVLADVGLLRVSHRTVTLVQPQAFPFVRREPN